MDLDDDRCYRAVKSRDRRFDGRFFTAVITTGIYCRPVCPARTPHRRNVRFYPCAAAAEDAGFRPCLRCRPETVPGSPSWVGAPAVVSRALRWIEGGDVPDGGLEALARRLEMTSRHLRRLFVEEVGVSPVALLTTRRLHLARRLLRETRLPIIDVAYAAGFKSLRRFNDAYRKSYGSPPSVGRTGPSRTGSGAVLQLELPWREPYDWDAVLSFLAPRAIPGVERIQGRRYSRLIRILKDPAVITVEPSAGGKGLCLALPGAHARHLEPIVRRVRRMFDLDAPVETIGALLARDPLLARAIARNPGLRIPGCWDPFELSVRAILGQQVSVTGATTLAGRLVRAHGTPVNADAAGLTHLFPTARALAKVDPASLGMPRSRASGLIAFARAVAEKSLSLVPGDSLERTVASLETVPGVGDWTAQYIAMRAFGEPDAFPSGDLGLRKALGDGLVPASARTLFERARSWQPFRAYAAMWLWSLPRTDKESR